METVQTFIFIGQFMCVWSGRPKDLLHVVEQTECVSAKLARAAGCACLHQHSFMARCNILFLMV